MHFTVYQNVGIFSKSDFFRKEKEFTVGAEVEVLVPENTTDPRLPSPVVVVSVNINSVYKFILFDFLILNSTVCMLEDSFRSKVLHEYFLLQKKGIFQYLGHRDGLPRDAPVFGDTSREPTAFPADKFHRPDYLVKHRRDFGTFLAKMITENLFLSN